MTLEQVVKNKFFAIGVASNLMVEWAKNEIEPPIDVTPPKPPTGTPKPDDSQYCWRPHVHSWRSSSSVTVTVPDNKNGGTKLKTIPFSFMNTEAGGIGGSGFKIINDSVDGEFWFRSGEGGQYGKGNDGNSFVSPLLEKYVVPVPQEIIDLVGDIGTDAKCVIVSGVDGDAYVFTPRYAWGNGTKVTIHPNTYIYLFGGNGENIDEDNKYWTCTYTTSGKGAMLGFYFDDTITDVGLKSVEIINNQNAMMSTQSHNIRIFDDDIRTGYGKVLCSGGRSCTMNVKGVNFNKMYACAGGGGGAGVAMNDEYSRAKAILNNYSTTNDSSFNNENVYVNLENYASASLNDLKGYTFTSGSMGLQLDVDIYGDVVNKDSKTFNYFSDLQIDIPINVIVELYSGEKYSIRLVKGVAIAPTMVLSTTLSIDLNAEFSIHNLDKNSMIKSLETRVYASQDVAVYKGGLNVTLMNLTDDDIANDSNIGVPTISFNSTDSNIEYTELLSIEPPKVGIRYLDIYDDTIYNDDLDVHYVPVSLPKTPDDNVGFDELVLIEKKG